jgi:hypothetical protein
VQGTRWRGERASPRVLSRWGGGGGFQANLCRHFSHGAGRQVARAGRPDDPHQPSGMRPPARAWRRHGPASLPDRLFRRRRGVSRPAGRSPPRRRLRCRVAAEVAGARMGQRGRAGSPWRSCSARIPAGSSAGRWPTTRAPRSPATRSRWHSGPGNPPSDWSIAPTVAAGTPQRRTGSLRLLGGGWLAPARPGGPHPVTGPAGKSTFPDARVCRLELGGRPIAEARVQPLGVVHVVAELRRIGLRFREGLVALRVHLSWPGSLSEWHYAAFA